MTLVVEDGTGLSNAESLLSVEDADAYFDGLGNDSWAGDDLTKEAALRRGTQYVCARYKFRGQPLNSTQALAWPRVCYSGPAWPVKSVQEATAEAAVRALTGDLYTDQSDAAVTRETVGPITVEYGPSQNGGQIRFSIIDDLLSAFTGGGRLSMRLERA